MKIAEAAARIGVPAHRLRHYESTGLLVPERTPAGYRVYSGDDVDRGGQIKALLEAGFTTADVALMLPCVGPDPDDDLKGCAVTRGKLVARLDQIRHRRAQLQRTEIALSAWLDLPEPEAAPAPAAAGATNLLARDGD